MKKILFYMLMLANVLFVSCSDDGDVNIISLNSFGSKFCRNDRVKVFVSAEVSDYTDVSYAWGCDGGTLTNPPGLFENVWQAPNEAGTYEVWCTVKCGGNEQTQRMKMVVTNELFYTDFETPYYNEGYSNSNMTVSFDAKKGTNGAAKLVAGGNDNNVDDNGNEILPYYPRFARDFTSPLPFSFQMDYALAAAMPNRDKDKSKDEFPEYVEQRFEFARLNGAMDYVSQVGFRIYPKTGVWEVVYLVQHLATADTERVVALTDTDAQFKLATNKVNTVAITMDANKNFIVYHNGEKFCETNALASKQDVYNISRTGLYMDEKIQMFTDNWYVFDDGTVCTAAPRER